MQKQQVTYSPTKTNSAYQSKIDAICPHYVVVSQDELRLTLFDTRYGVTFTYLKKQFPLNLNKKVEGVFWSATRGNVVAVLPGEDPFRLEAQVRLDAVTPGSFRVVSFDRASDTAVVTDLSTNATASFKFKSWLGNLGRNSVPAKVSNLHSDAQESLDTITSGRFIVLSTSVENGSTTVVIKEVSTGFVFKQKLSYIVHRLKEDPKRSFDRSVSNEVRKNTNLERYGVDVPLKSAEIKSKMRTTLKTKYGEDVTNVSQLSSHSAKFKETSLSRYGTDHPMRNKEVVLKVWETSKSNHDGIFHLNHPEVIRRIKDTNREKYGADTPFESPVILAKAKETLLKNHGVTNSQHIPGVKDKSQRTRVEAGTQTLIKGRTIREVANEIGSAYSFVQRLVLRYGVEKAKPLIDSYTPGGSSLTVFVASMFSEFNPIVDRKLPGTNFRPDLRFEEEKVIIEADGLYWHSDGSKTEKWNPDRAYHSTKLKAYEDLGYRALFFRSDEICSKPEVVKSVVLNVLKKNTKKIAARKCSVQHISSTFFDTVHLMGAGQGRCYGLVHNGEVVAGIQVKLVSKETNLLDVSRFACASGTTVVGGWSRLLDHVIRQEKPTQIQTFIDRRYGNGSHLSRLGWNFVREEPSFQWTDGIKTYHRMNHPGKTGYDHGLFKIWDCGQARWVLNVS